MNGLPVGAATIPSDCEWSGEKLDLVRLGIGMSLKSRFQKFLAYDPVTGVFRWKVDRCRRGSMGTIAGSINGNGYRSIWIDGRQYLAHRLAWLFVHGAFPTGMLDHINCDRADNRIENLREATYAQNSANRRLNKNNSLGVKGVYRTRSGRYAASIRINGKLKHLGTTDNIVLADYLYRIAAAVYFREFARAA